MNLLYIIDSIGAGGAEHSLAAMAPYYGLRGVSLDVAYLHDRPGLQGELEKAGAHLFSLEGSGGRIGWIRRARRLISERRPDLVHTTLFEADIAGRIAATLTRVPVVSSLVNVGYGPEQLGDPQLRPLRMKAARVVDSITARRVIRFHAVTNYVADTMSSRLRIPRAKIDVIPRGRHPDHLGTRDPDRRARSRAALGIEDDSPVILAVARHEHPKGLDLLLRAMPLVLRDAPRARLFVAGREGGRTAELRSRAHELNLGDSVSFLGPRSDVPDLLCAADAFAFPSRWEGFPGALLEAMALQTPIIASDLPNIREATGEGEAALLITPENPDALALGIVQTLADRQGAEQRAACGRIRFIERFTVDRVADAMVDFYHRALRSRAGKRQS